MPKPTLYLLDAYALIFRAYYAFLRNPRINSKGLNTSAMFGFVNALEDVINNRKPTHLAVCFDHKSPNVRVQEFPYYKANRQETPEDIRISEPYIRNIIEAYNIPILEAQGYEADDVIGTLAKMAEKEGYEVYMVTPDKDFGQLVSENIYIYKPARQGGDAEVWGPKEVIANYGIHKPEQVIDILALMGDAVDNIPGVLGVGEKGASKLIHEYHSVEAIYENIHQLKGALKDKMEKSKQNAFDSKKLATILLDAPVLFEPDRLIMEAPDATRLSAIFSELEFRALGKRILGDSYEVNTSSTETTATTPNTPTGNVQSSLFQDLEEEDSLTRGPSKGRNITNTPHTYHAVTSEQDTADLKKKLLAAKEFAFDTETTGLDAEMEIVGMSFSLQPGEAYYVPTPLNFEEAKKIVQSFKEVFTNPDALKVGHNIKFDMKLLLNYGVEVAEPIYDTMVAHFVADAHIRHKMDVMAEAYLGYSPVPITDLIGKRGKNQLSMQDIDLERIKEYASEDADITLQLKSVTDKMLADVKAEDLVKKLEFPLIHVLTDMEFEGIRLDVPFLNEYSKFIGAELYGIRENIFKLSGVEFNLDSPRQLGDILFEHLKIPYEGAKTKTGQYGTSEDILSPLRLKHEIIDHIINYRELTKLKSTYVDALPALVNPSTGKLHTTFGQTIAATGRLASNNPNLQNIPIRTDRGKEIRKAFIPRDDDHLILSADYSQIELRIIAAITQDEGMLEAFNRGEDIHASTASKVFNVPLSEVSKEMRRRAKAVNFGLAYGQSAFGLSQTLGISRSESKEIIDNYFLKFPGIKNYMAETVKFAEANGYVETIMKRRRYLRDINSKNNVVRSQAARNAINSPIQGSAADMIKMAMIDIYHEIRNRKLKSRMLLQVHDELVFDLFKPEEAEMRAMVEDKMKHAIPDLPVPVEVGMGTGINWLEAH
ncbi:MAG TPA: DNA polymerase I [Saprospiraceae bacterium]|nr:DNA polymerase I [Saprospiraceae bacterium]